MDIKLVIPAATSDHIDQVADRLAAKLERRLFTALAALMSEMQSAARPPVQTRRASQSPGRLGISDLVVRLNVSRRTIARWVASGELPAPHFVGEHRKWWQHEIEAWEAASVVQETQRATAANLRKLAGAP